MQEDRPLLSVVVPILNEEAALPETARRLLALVGRMSPAVDVELIFVDDGSTDGSLTCLRDLALTRPYVKVLSLSRNFGHQIAITAGIDVAAGSHVAIIDGDLQDPPELIDDMYRVALTGFDVVYGQRRSRAGESIFKKATAAAFYRLLNVVCDVEIPRDTGDFRLMSRRVVDAFKQLRERHRFVRGMVPWLGYRAVAIEYDRAERRAGETKFPLGKMLHFAADAILSFSSKPLSMATRLGAATIAVGLLGGLAMLYLKLFTDRATPGMTAVILTVVVFAGIQIFLIGVVGSYIARIFEEVKRRPLYLVGESHNVDGIAGVGGM